MQILIERLPLMITEQTVSNSASILANKPLTHCLYTVFEKLLPMVENKRLTPNHQFGLRQWHSTIDQIH
jgi:hypothetical protein